MCHALGDSLEERGADGLPSAYARACTRHIGSCVVPPRVRPLVACCGARFFWSDRCECGDRREIGGGDGVTDCVCLSVLGHVWRHRGLSHMFICGSRAMLEAYRCRPLVE